MLTEVQKKENAIFLDRARSTAYRLLLSHPDGLGIDDIRSHCELCGIQPVNPSLWGAVVRDPRFVRNGDRRSKNPRTHGRWINLWRLR